MSYLRDGERFHTDASGKVVKLDHDGNVIEIIEDGEGVRVGMMMLDGRNPSMRPSMSEPAENGKAVSARDRYIQRLNDSWRNPDRDAYIERLNNSWRNPDAPRDDNEDNWRPGAIPVISMADAQKLRDESYARYCQRLRDGWKTDLSGEHWAGGDVRASQPAYDRHVRNALKDAR